MKQAKPLWFIQWRRKKEEAYRNSCLMVSEEYISDAIPVM